MSIRTPKDIGNPTMKQSIQSVSLQALEHEDAAAVEVFSTSLQTRGFGVVRLDNCDDSSLLREALLRCKSMGEFRFPPVGESAHYKEEHKACFKVLFRITRQCLKALLGGHREFQSTTTPLFDALEESFSPGYALFGDDEEENYPFGNDDAAFATSFFNIFHYDYGLLNAHRDRCLLTAIFVNQETTEDLSRSALWVKGADDAWVNADAMVESNEVVILLGEEFQSLAESAGLSLRAAEHCIRVDPKGPNLERAHHRADPATPPKGNRMSAALILSH